MGDRHALLKPVAEIRDPIHGYIMVTELERKLIDTAPFQRLHYIRQLAGAHYVYPGADHTRFGHSLGVMHLAGIIGQHLHELGHIDVDEVQLLRIAGLLHDLGHGPFSHIYEELLVKYRGQTHEDLTQWLIKESEIKDILSDYGYDPKLVAELAIGKPLPDKRFLSQVISYPFDADKMDFLVRDSHFTGVEYGYVDVYRLIYSIDVVDGDLALRLPGALHAIEAFIIARYEMFKAVYFHRTVRSAEILLIRAMDAARDALGLVDFKTPEEYIKLDDCWVLAKLRELSKDPSKQTDESLKLAAQYYEMLERRRLLKCAYEAILHVTDTLTANLLMRFDIRRQLEEDIAKRANVDPSTVILDLPSVPSIPYTPRQLEPFEIPVFELDEQGRPVRRRLTEISRLIDVLRGYMDVARVYTLPEQREVVAKAAREVLGGPSPLATVST